MSCNSCRNHVCTCSDVPNAKEFIQMVLDADSEKLITQKLKPIEGKVNDIIQQNQNLVFINREVKQAITDINEVKEIKDELVTNLDTSTEAINNNTATINSLVAGVEKQVSDAILNSGYVVLDSFETGNTIYQRNEVLKHELTGKIYRWAGKIPKVVPTSSTPTSTGGIAANAWLEVSDSTLRSEILTGGLITDELIKTQGGLAQTVINNGVVSIDELLTIKNPKDGMRVYIQSYYEGLGKGGGYFIYDSAKASLNDGGTIFNGWVREYNRLYLTDFGAYSDGISDDTQALIKAAQSGLKIIVTGKNAVKTRATVLTKSLTLLGEGEAEFIVSSGGLDGLFSFSGTTEDIKIEGIAFTTLEGNSQTVFWDMRNLTNVINNFSVKYCKFNNTALMHIYGTENINPEQHLFGITNFKVLCNEFNNVSRNLVTLMDLPTPNLVFERNKVLNLSQVAFYSNINNDAIYDQFLYGFNNMIVRNNYIYNEDSYWSDSTSVYFNVALFRGNYLEYKNNTAIGMKTNKTKSLHDVYAMPLHLVHEDNVFLNFGCFDYDTDISKASAPELFKAKNTSERLSDMYSVELNPLKSYQRNIYQQSPKWLVNIGMTDKPPVSSLSNTGIYGGASTLASGGDIIIKDNTIDLYCLLGSKRNIATSLVIVNNNIKIRKHVSGIIFSYAAYSTSSTAVVCNNHFSTIGDQPIGGEVCHLFGNASFSLLNAWDSVILCGNSISATKALKYIQIASLTANKLIMNSNSQHSSNRNMLMGTVTGTIFGKANTQDNPLDSKLHSGAYRSINAIGEFEVNYTGVLDYWSGIYVEIANGKPKEEGRVKYEHTFDLDNENGTATFKIIYTINYTNEGIFLEYLDNKNLLKTVNIPEDLSSFPKTHVNNLKIIEDTGALKTNPYGVKLYLRVIDGSLRFTTEHLYGTESNENVQMNMHYTYKAFVCKKVISTEDFEIPKEKILGGPTSERPTNAVIGQSFYDTTLSKAIFWTGSSWVDSVGEVV